MAGKPMADLEPYHEGELAVQARAESRDEAEQNAAMLGASLPAPMRAFLAAQRTLALGALDGLGRPWASLWSSSPGFVTSAGTRIVRIARDDRVAAADDPLRALLVPGRDVGLLAIELSSRRRLRINGAVARADEHRVEIDVREVFANCPKYIQRREPIRGGAAATTPPSERGVALDPARRALLERADTLFVASSHPTRGVDVSHRGGEPGFVRVLDDRTLRIPDYSGNGMFQTLGNFEVVPRAGLVAVDFERRRLLSLTGTVSVSFGAEDPSHPSGGTGRYWSLVVAEWREFAAPVGLAFRLVESSPFNPPSCPLPS
jgi:predicted pyridoxine 5'-phosphate oxidase superfamily flavin-nucleotide-binding protein